jgi:hypothetical protein
MGESNNNGAQSTWEEAPKKIEATTTALNSMATAIEKVNKATSKTKPLNTDRVSVDTSMSNTKADLFDEASWYKGVLDRMKTIKGPMIETAKEIENAYLDMSSAIAGSISMVANDIGEALGGNKDVKFGDSILKALAAFARSVGEALIGIGTAMLAAKAMIKNPYTAIAAGIALVALSGALSASLSKSQNNFNSSGASGANTAAPSAVRSSDSERIHFDARFRIEGDDLVTIIDRTNRQNGRLRG